MVEWAMNLTAIDICDVIYSTSHLFGAIFTAFLYILGAANRARCVQILRNLAFSSPRPGRYRYVTERITTRSRTLFAKAMHSIFSFQKSQWSLLRQVVCASARTSSRRLSSPEGLPRAPAGQYRRPSPVKFADWDSPCASCSSPRATKSSGPLVGEFSQRPHLIPWGERGPHGWSCLQRAARWDPKFLHTAALSRAANKKFRVPGPKRCCVDLLAGMYARPIERA